MSASVPNNEVAWWKSAVVYQIYPRSFADSNGDGIGDLPGAIQHLDYLKHLGVDVVWLSPVYPSPMDDNGYDISDYQDVDPMFGSLADLDQLIEGLHERGIKLVLDLVVNHTSDEHPWFVESRSSKQNPKREWFWWRPAREGMNAGDPGAEPTNWASFFSGPAWELDEATGEYYLHLFSRKQPDLNWENPRVRDAVYAMMRWWLDRGVDGFRMDVINMISKDPKLPDGRCRPAGGPLGDGSEHFICGPRIHEFLHEMHEQVFAGRPGLLLAVGEMPGVTVEEARLFTDPGRAEVDMVFQFEHVGIDQGATKWDVLPFDLRALKASLGRWQVGLGDVGWNSLYWDNHDQPRVVSRFGDDGEFRVRSAKLLATVLHLHKGTPYVYQGEELGMTNYPFTGIEQFQDIESVNHYREAVAHGVPVEHVLDGLQKISRDNGRNAHAVGRRGTRGLHRRASVAGRQPQLPRDQRRGGARGPGLRLPPLPPVDRAAALRAGGGARRLHDAGAGRRADLRVRPQARRRPAPRDGELLRGAARRRRPAPGRPRGPRRIAGSRRL
jgi:oligo-1,6-glucosidase